MGIGHRRTWLKKMRFDKGYTQSAIAILLGCSTQMYWRIENGENNPGLAVAVKLAEILDFDVKLLLE